MGSVVSSMPVPVVCPACHHEVSNKVDGNRRTKKRRNPPKRGRDAAKLAEAKNSEGTGADSLTGADSPLEAGGVPTQKQP